MTGVPSAFEMFCGLMLKDQLHIRRFRPGRRSKNEALLGAVRVEIYCFVIRVRCGLSQHRHCKVRAYFLNHDQDVHMRTQFLELRKDMHR
jgi:hypothetical protein